MNQSAITAIIPCFNEEDCIARAIDSVLWADEIIIVDSYSSDSSIDIIQQYSQVTLIQHVYENSARQKNWIIPQAKNEWVFLLDADEICSVELQKEILHLDLSNRTSSDSRSISKEAEITAYAIPRENYFFERKLRYIWKSDIVNRLFAKESSRYQDLKVHSKLLTDGGLGRLTASIEHHSFKSMDHYKAKLERYAVWSAGDYDEKTGTIGIFQLYVKPAARFIKHYFIQGGILDGKAGFVISKMQAWAVKRRYEKMKELRKERKSQ